MNEIKFEYKLNEYGEHVFSLDGKPVFAFTNSSDQDFHTTNYITGEDYEEHFDCFKDAIYEFKSRVCGDLERLFKDATEEVRDKLQDLLDEYYKRKKNSVIDCYLTIDNEPYHVHLDNLKCGDIIYPYDLEVKMGIHESTALRILIELASRFKLRDVLIMHTRCCMFTDHKLIRSIGEIPKYAKCPKCGKELTFQDYAVAFEIKE